MNLQIPASSAFSPITYSLVDQIICHKSNNAKRQSDKMTLLKKINTKPDLLMTHLR